MDGGMEVWVDDDAGEGEKVRSMTVCFVKFSNYLAFYDIV